MGSKGEDVVAVYTVQKQSLRDILAKKRELEGGMQRTEKSGRSRMTGRRALREQAKPTASPETSGVQEEELLPPTRLGRLIHSLLPDLQVERIISAREKEILLLGSLHERHYTLPILLQAKEKKQISEKDIYELLGRAGEVQRQPVLITTGSLTRQARQHTGRIILLQETAHTERRS